jgi:hypothetical protein
LIGSAGHNRLHGRTWPKYFVHVIAQRPQAMLAGVQSFQAITSLGGIALRCPQPRYLCGLRTPSSLVNEFFSASVLPSRFGSLVTLTKFTDGIKSYLRN